MRANRRQAAALAVGAALWPLQASTQAPAPRLGELKPLGNDRFQVGRIVVDKRAARFTVPGRVLVLGKPLEYLATSPGGMKAYEAMLEVDASGSEFNLACILVGLERDPKQPDWRNFRQSRLTGRPIGLFIAWGEGDKRRQITAAEGLLNPEAGVKPETVQWVYTGSPASEARGGGIFAADETGTLISFIHDANTVLDSSFTIGVGAYGSVRGSALMPPEGTAIELIVDARPPKR